MNKWLIKALAGIISIGAFIPIARTATIVGPFSFSPSNVGTGIVQIDAAGNPHVTKNFTTSDTLWMTFNLSGVGGSTIYSIFESVFNNTGDIWEDIIISMGCGTLPNCPFDPVWLTNNTVPTNSEPGSSFTLGGLTSPGNHNTQLHWVGMNVAPGEAFDLAFSITTCENCSGTWAIAETPSVVPEPGTLALFGVALTGIGFLRRRASR